jgi:menaquinone-specific isochorismate synthase
MMYRFTTRPLSDFVDEVPDLNDLAGDDGMLFVRDGTGFAGVASVARVPLSECAEFFVQSTIDDRVDAPGSRGVAFGWYPFTGVGGEAIIPAICVGKHSSMSPWVTYVEGNESQVAAALASRHASVSASSGQSAAEHASFAIRPGVEIAQYLIAVAAVCDAVRNGEITKAVIARDILVESSQPIAVNALLRRLKASFGSSYRYSIDGLVGASPELLVARQGDVVTSHPLAGTAPRTGNPTTDDQLAQQLRASAKNQIEHRVVIDMVHDTLLPWCSYLDWQPEPDVVAVANVQHLGTLIEGRLSQPIPHVLQLVEALSPTPALGGFPRDAALRLIAQHEGMQRGRYGGAVGWCDRDGNGTWAVAIRCAELSSDRRTARLFAGGGIVADSEPLAELAETQAKFQAMLSALVRP